MLATYGTPFSSRLYVKQFKGIDMKNPYPNEKFSAAVNSMATSPKSLQERICDAYVYNLIHVKPEDLPESVQHDFIQLAKKLTAVEPKSDEGSVAATTRQMSTTDAIEIADIIVRLADDIRSDYEEG